MFLQMFVGLGTDAEIIKLALLFWHSDTATLFFQVGTVYQLIITISILLSQVLGMGSILGNEAGWPFLLGLTIIPGILQVKTTWFNQGFLYGEVEQML